LSHQKLDIVVKIYRIPLNTMIFCKSSIIWFEFDPLGFAKRTDARTTLSFFLCTTSVTKPEGSRAVLSVDIARASNPSVIALKNSPIHCIFFYYCLYILSFMPCFFLKALKHICQSKIILNQRSIDIRYNMRYL